MPPGKKNKWLFSYYKRLKMNFFSFLASWLSPNAIKNWLHEHHCIIRRPAWCIGGSAIKCIWDDITIRWCLMLHDFLLCITANQTANKHSLLQWWCSQRSQTVSSDLPFFQYTAAVDSILQYVQTNSSERLMLIAELSQRLLNVKFKLLSFARWCYFVQ